MIDYANHLVVEAEAAREAGDSATAAAKYLEAAVLGIPDLGDAIRTELLRVRAKADSGDLDAQAQYGHMATESGLDVAGGIRNLERAAAGGSTLAQRVLGHVLVQGTGVERDTKRAVALFQEAADAGDGLSAFNLAAAYFLGDGVPQDGDKAIELLVQAADAGVPEAMCKLAEFLSPEDRDEEALSWFLRAASVGSAPGMFAAGCWYRDGYGTSVDNVQALRWFLSMQNVGDRDGMHDAMELAKTMCAEDVREAARLAERAPDGEILLKIAHRGR